LGIPAHVLHRHQQVAIVALVAHGQLLQQLQQRGAGVPVPGGRRGGDVVAAQGRHRHHAARRDAGLAGKGQQRALDRLERGLRPRWLDRVQLVHGKHQAGHAQQLRQQAVAARLRQQLHRLGGDVQLGDVHQHHGGIAAGRGGDHVAGVLLVAGCVGDDELAPPGGEVAVRHVDGDALLALGLQAVGEQREVDRGAGGALFQRIQLVGQDGAAVEQQPADQRALAVVHAAGGEEAQGLVLQFRPGVVMGGGGRVHQK
jgi:hypothetical protein